jgi:predicted DNA-binding antitoxin AbrB/MazE fold protein
MQILFQAIYENGVLRPLEPLDLEENQQVTITISIDSERRALHPRLDGGYRETLLRQLKDAGPPPGLEAVRRMLSKIPGEMTEDFIAERGER